MTLDRTIVGAGTGHGGYRQLVTGPGGRHVDREDLFAAVTGDREALLTIAHLSDLHACDAQSPARAEFLDRWADPDSPVRDQLGEVGTYRAQEMLTAQVGDAMVRALNAVSHGPVGAASVDLAISTGDNTDNAQLNELRWYLTLLEGGEVRPDSGDTSRWEGVADGQITDERFWHPETATFDRPRSEFGFPVVAGLLDAARRPFHAAGLGVPWLAVHGNHDQLVQGTLPAVGLPAAAAVGAAKAIGLPPDWTTEAIVALVAGLNACDPDALGALARARMRVVTPDPDRRVVERPEFIAAHFSPLASPTGHGFTEANLASGRAYYRRDHGSVSLLMLDTVNEHGGWQGSLDREQLRWVEAQLSSADADRRYVVLASHHPLRDLVNANRAEGAAPRVLADRFEQTLAKHPCVVLWLNGHTHRTAVTAHDSWWEVTAPSLIDWPQQARIVELLRAGGGLTVAATMIDHVGPVPWGGGVADAIALAGLSRELAANDWQWREHPLEDHPRAGQPTDRNVLLHLRDPWA